MQHMNYTRRNNSKMADIDTSKFLNKWTTQDVSYLTRDLLTAAGIGCTDLNFVYENDKGFEAFPTYPIVLSFKGTDQDVLKFPSKAAGKGPSMLSLPGVIAGLDGERYIEKVKEIPKGGAKLRLRQRLLAYKSEEVVPRQQEAISKEKMEQSTTR